jgi:hypothetical protein
MASGEGTEGRGLTKEAGLTEEGLKLALEMAEEGAAEEGAGTSLDEGEGADADGIDRG